MLYGEKMPFSRSRKMAQQGLTEGVIISAFLSASYVGQRNFTKNLAKLVRLAILIIVRRSIAKFEWHLKHVSKFGSLLTNQKQRLKQERQKMVEGLC